jgi:vacuolar iron transporter family protein
VQGADDGIVSVAGIVLGVAGATSARGRVVIGGGLGLALTYAIGRLVGTAIK